LQFLNSTLGQFFTFIHTIIHNIIPNVNYSYGLAIIAFTAIIRVCLLPLTIKQTRSQVKMQEVQPRVKELQAKYKNDPKKSQEEVMKLYKETGSNPISGCLPLIIQLPIIWALFYVFNHLTAINGVHFLWIKDLSQADPYYILPILSTITTYISSRLMTPPGDSAQAKQTSTMNTAMAVVFGFMSIKFKSAIVLYWVTQNLFQIGQTIVMKKMDRKIKE
jgi:YidC/Oxa1 family membrane protein insertase